MMPVYITWSLIEEMALEPLQAAIRVKAVPLCSYAPVDVSAVLISGSTGHNHPTMYQFYHVSC